MVKGQTEMDSIVFHGRIVNDGMAYWYSSSEERNTVLPHFIKIKNNLNTIQSVEDARFSIKCIPGDTIVIRCSDILTTPFSYQVELVANDTVSQDIHVWAYPAATDNWYDNADYATERIFSGKDREVSDLTGTYKYTWHDEYGNNKGITLKLEENKIFETLCHGFDWDYYWVDYYIGKWDIQGDTLICRVIPDLYPPLKQERYPGQILYFDGWGDDKRKAMEETIIFKFLIRRRGLIENSGREKRIYKKVSRIGSKES